jgi:hypothetical protein
MMRGRHHFRLNLSLPKLFTFQRTFLFSCRPLFFTLFGGLSMWHALVNLVFGCSHRRTTFPFTPRRKPGRICSSAEMYVVCLDCGTEFAYDWQEMRVRKSVEPMVPTCVQKKPAQTCVAGK